MREVQKYIKDMEVEHIKLLSETRNNGVKSDRLAIRLKDHPISPVVPIKHYFDMYEAGKDIEAVMESIASDFVGGLYQPYTVPLNKLKDYEAIKKDVFLRVVNWNLNKVALASCPYVRKLDLALTFRVRFEQGDEGLSSMLVDSRLLEDWGVTVDELYMQAMMNTIEKFPPVFESSEELFEQMLSGDWKGLYTKEDFSQLPLFVLTNTLRINGATALFYPGVVKSFAEYICKDGTDLYLLPSSIHEWMIVPAADGGASASEYQKVVKAVNRDIVSPEEVLSEQVYVYHYAEDEISISTRQTI